MNLWPRTSELVAGSTGACGWASAASLVKTLRPALLAVAVQAPKKRNLNKEEGGQA
jgi:hypothetical protein